MLTKGTLLLCWRTKLDMSRSRFTQPLNLKPAKSLTTNACILTNLPVYTITNHCILTGPIVQRRIARTEYSFMYSKCSGVSSVCEHGSIQSQYFLCIV